MVFVFALALVLFLPVESDAGPCEENKIRQQSMAETVKEKASVFDADRAKHASIRVSKSEKHEAKSVSPEKAKTKPGKLSKVVSSPEKLEVKPDESVKVTSEPEKPEVKAENAASELTGDVKAEKSGVKSEQVPAIDMEVLTKRLKETKAIGLFTKLAIRNDVSDLVDDVKRYRKKSMLATKMKEIRESFEGLLLKIVALLEGDPELSRDLYVGRESIWKSLLEVKA
jgi:hypothetical protein